MMIKQSLTLAFTLLTAILSADKSSGAAAAEEKVRFSVAAITGSYMDEFVAIEKGYHREDGLAVEMIRAGGGIATQALIGGDLHEHLGGFRAQRHVARRGDQSCLHQHRSPRRYRERDSLCLRRLGGFQPIAVAPGPAEVYCDFRD